MIKTEINPKHKYLTSFVEDLVDVFESDGEEIYRGRNVIRVYSIGKLPLNVKRYHIPHGLNRLLYSWGIRTPKARRAYRYAKILNDKGIDTPSPIGWLEERNGIGLLGYSYLVTLQCDYGHTLYEMGNAKPGTYEQMAKALAHFAANIHNRQVLHKDFTPGNILWKQDEEGFHFMLIDINRMRFGTVSVKEGLFNLRKLWGPKEFIRLLVTEYARVRNYPEQKAVDYVMKSRKRFWTRYQRKHDVPFLLEL